MRRFSDSRIGPAEPRGIRVPLVDTPYSAKPSRPTDPYSGLRTLGRALELIGFSPGYAESLVAAVELVGLGYLVPGNGGKLASLADVINTGNALTSEPGKTPYGLARKASFVRNNPQLALQNLAAAIFRVTPEEVLLIWALITTMGEAVPEVETSGSAYDVHNYLDYSKSNELAFSVPEPGRSRPAAPNNERYLDRGAFDRERADREFGNRDLGDWDRSTDVIPA